MLDRKLYAYCCVWNGVGFQTDIGFYGKRFSMLDVQRIRVKLVPASLTKKLLTIKKLSSSSMYLREKLHLESLSKMHPGG